VEPRKEEEEEEEEEWIHYSLIENSLSIIDFVSIIYPFNAFL
jgi:hypothetical protein